MQTTLLQAVILRSIPYLDNDAIVEFLCAKHGKVSVIAKGVQKQASKNKGSLRCFSFVECEIFLPKNNNTLGKLIRVHPLYAFLDEDIISQSLLSIASQCTTHFLSDHHCHPEILSLWVTLIKTKKIQLKSLYWFLCRLFSTLGIFPSFQYSSTSHQKFSPQDTFYWNAEDGINAVPCMSQRNEHSISFPVLKYFSFASKSSFSETQKIQLSKTQEQEIWSIIWWFYAQHSKFPPKAKKIFESFL